MSDALNAHAHFHALLPDGLFVPSEAEGENEPLVFVELPIPSREELEKLTEKIARRITRLVEKLSTEEVGQGSLDETALALSTRTSTACSPTGSSFPLLAKGWSSSRCRRRPAKISRRFSARSPSD